MHFTKCSTAITSAWIEITAIYICDRETGQEMSRVSVRRTHYRKQNKELLIVFPHTVVDPGTVVVHLSDAALANCRTGERLQLSVKVMTPKLT